jgi:hypothetical protein
MLGLVVRKGHRDDGIALMERPRRFPEPPLAQRSARAHG